MSLLEDLQWRGLIADCTDRDGLARRLAKGPITVYAGFDPTADSLHVGHLMGQLMLRRFQLAGHHPIAIAGGATGMVGDPSGKSAERNLLTREQLDHNVRYIKAQLSRILDFEAPSNPARLVDNADWTARVGFLDFLRDIGKHFPLNAMLAKESVRARMAAESGISYTEFSYMLLQAFDFFHLRQTMNCELQVGGSDQYGNITAGCDLIRRKLGATAWGLTFPLITRSDGVKFGKTEEGAVWLDPARTSPYRFHQFFINTEDVKVVEYLRKFTLLPREEIDALAACHAANPGAREAHRALAAEVTRLVHGTEALDAAVKASAILFGGAIEGVTAEVFQQVVGEIPTKTFPKDKLLRSTTDLVIRGSAMTIAELLVYAQLAPSKGQARKDIEAGGAYLNNVRVDNTRLITANDLLYQKYLLLRKGKKSYALLEAVD